MKEKTDWISIIGVLLIVAFIFSFPFWAVDWRLVAETDAAQCRCLADHPDEFKGHYHCGPQNTTEDDLIRPHLQNLDGCACTNKYPGYVNGTCMV